MVSALAAGIRRLISLLRRHANRQPAFVRFGEYSMSCWQPGNSNVRLRLPMFVGLWGGL
jgi:hypothetical protein